MTAAAPLPSQDELRRVFKYDPMTGELFWRVRPHPRSVARAGDPIKTRAKDGYTQVMYRKKTYRVHRLIWKMAFGVEPDEIDHKNGDRADNRIENLRATTRSGNSQNRRILRNNTVGFKGVVFVSRLNRFKARIDVGGKRKSLGTYPTAAEAHAAYVAAAKMAYGEFANDGAVVSEESKRAALLPTPKVRKA